MIAPLDTTTRRRSLRFRCSALLWAVVFVLSGVRPAFAEAGCAHHASHGTHAEAAAPERPAADQGRHHGAGHGPDAHHGAAAEPGHPSDNDPSHDGICTCVGPCHAASAPVLLVAIPAVPAPVELLQAPLPAPGDLASLPGRTAFLLPYATAPPRDR